MKKISVLSLVFLTLVSCNKDNLTQDFEEQACDGGVFVGEVRLVTQAEVNEFGENCYTKINGSLFLGNLDSSIPTDINDLSPLNSLVEIFTETADDSGKLWISNNPNLLSLEGLNNLQKVNALTIRLNDGLINLNGLNSLSVINGSGTIKWLLIHSNNQLENIDGLENLTTIGALENEGEGISDVIIHNNNTLGNLDGLFNLQNVYGDIYIGHNEDPIVFSEGNEELNDFCGITNLLTNGIYNTITIGNNEYNPTVQDIIDGNCSL